ncbi:MAG: SDR family NAD(P)-dependent oxidoreductase [Bacilli bacterium]|nr:SDR family NAD(P)-dependent oxidoreductase [Bacilli bacterium]
MKAIITGASSGIGKDMARYLSTLGYDLVLVARREERLKELKKELKTKVEIVPLDLGKKESCYELYEKYQSEQIDIFINNAGFGLFGDFLETDLDRELEMIGVNVIALHILTKLFVQKMDKQKFGYILNVCSSAGFLAGPRLSTYYATKNYALKLTMAIYHELKRRKSNVVISALCPGPVDTEFNKVAQGKFKIAGASSEYVAKYAIDKLLQKKLFIIPKLSVKLAIIASRFTPYKALLSITDKIQYRKNR